MAADLYVPDANVFLKYIYARPLQEISKNIMRDAVLEKIQLAVPCLLLDEFGTGRSNALSVEKAVNG